MASPASATTRATTAVMASVSCTRTDLGRKTRGSASGTSLPCQSNHMGRLRIPVSWYPVKPRPRGAATDFAFLFDPVRDPPRSAAGLLMARAPPDEGGALFVSEKLQVVN